MGACVNPFQGLATGGLLNSPRRPGPSLGRKSINKMYADLNKKKLNFVNCILCEINKAKDYLFTLLAKY